MSRTGHLQASTLDGDVLDWASTVQAVLDGTADPDQLRVEVLKPQPVIVAEQRADGDGDGEPVESV